MGRERREREAIRAGEEEGRREAKWEGRKDRAERGSIEVVTQ